MVNIPAKFDKEIHNSLVSIVNASLVIAQVKYNNAKRSIPAHPTFVNDTHRDLYLWTVTSKINRVYHG